MNFSPTMVLRLAKTEGLAYRENGGFVSVRGLRARFPVLLMFAARNLRRPVVINARLAPGSPTALPRAFAPPLDALIRAGAAQPSARGQYASLTLQSGFDRLKHGDLMPALDAFLGGLVAAGVQPQRACGWCGSTKEDAAVFSSDERVGLVCAACLAKREEDFRAKHGYLPSSLPKLIVLGAAALVGIALLWAGLNIGADHALRAVRDPSKFQFLFLLLLAPLAAGVLTALPALFFTLVPRRGVWPTLAAALAAGLLAILVGEAMHVRWLLDERGGAVAGLLPTPGEFWNVAFSGPGSYSLARALLSLSTLACTAFLAVPHRPRLVP